MFNYRGNFEVHVTIRMPVSLSAFRNWCEDKRCKFVWIVLARGVEVQQPMATWRRAETVFSEVLTEVRQQVISLETTGFTVVRVKIEADPFNDQVPVSDDAARLEPGDRYFEHHVKLRRVESASHDALLDVCQNHGAHLSHNAWRQSVGGIEERFVTLRSHGVGRESSDLKLKQLLRSLEAAGEQILEVESEYAVYDSNLFLDDGWLPGML